LGDASKCRGLPWGLSSKESTCLLMKETQECGFNPWIRKMPRSRKWQPSLVFLPGKFHGQRSLVGYSSRGHKESDTTEHMLIIEKI